MKKVKSPSMITLLGVLAILTIAFNYGCSQNKKKVTIDQLLIEPKGETYDEAIERRANLSLYPVSHDDYERQDAIRKEINNIDDKLERLRWEERVNEEGSGWKTNLLIILGVILGGLFIKDQIEAK